MQNDFEKNYSSSSNGACSKKENCVDLLRKWKEDQTFLQNFCRKSKDSRFNPGTQHMFMVRSNVVPLAKENIVPS